MTRRGFPARRGISQGSTSLVLGAAALAGLLVGLSVRVFRVRSGSMAPTLHDGDLVLGVRRLGRPRRDHVYALSGHRTWRLKRVVGLPEDAVALRGPWLLRNQRRVHEAQVRYRQGGIVDLPATVLRAGELLALGDNRDDSLDSRHLGPFPVAAAQFHLVARLWPPDRAGWVE